MSLSFLAIIAIANAMGTIASAGVDIAEKLCAFVMPVPSAYMQSMSAFVAQNIGAGREDRARKALLCGILSSFAAGLLMRWAAFFRGDVLAGLFAEDGAVIPCSSLSAGGQSRPPLRRDVVDAVPYESEFHEKITPQL